MTNQTHDSNQPAEDELLDCRVHHVVSSSEPYQERQKNPEQVVSEQMLDRRLQLLNDKQPKSQDNSQDDQNDASVHSTCLTSNNDNSRKSPALEVLISATARIQSCMLTSSESSPSSTASTTPTWTTLPPSSPKTSARRKSPTSPATTCRGQMMPTLKQSLDKSGLESTPSRSTTPTTSFKPFTLAIIQDLLHLVDPHCDYDDVIAKENILRRLRADLAGEQGVLRAVFMVTARTEAMVDIFDVASALMSQMLPAGIDQDIGKLHCLETYFRLLFVVTNHCGLEYDSHVHHRVLQTNIHHQMFMLCTAKEDLTLSLKNVIAKALLSFLNPKMQKSLEKSVCDYRTRLWRMFSLGKMFLKLVSINCLVNYWSDKLIKTISKQMVTSDMLQNCLELAKFYESRPSVYDALAVLYLQLARLDQNSVRSFFTQIDLQNVLSQLDNPQEAQEWIFKLNQLQSKLEPEQDELTTDSWPPCERKKSLPGRNGPFIYPRGHIRQSMANLKVEGSIRCCKVLSDLYDDGSASTTKIEVFDRAEELSSLIRDQCQPVYRNVYINKSGDDIYLDKMPCDKTLGQNVVALLNADAKDGLGSWIYIGVKSSGCIDGVMMTRKQRDIFRQKFDGICMHQITPKLPILMLDRPVKDPEFHVVIDSGGDTIYERYVIKIKVCSGREVFPGKDFKLKGGGLFRRINGTTRLIQV